MRKNKEDSTAYQKQWRAIPENREKEKIKNKVRKEACVAYMQNLKSTTPCMDCGVQYPYYVMDFDHRDPTTKVGGVREIAAGGSMNNMLKEIDKCDVVCANCHRQRTHDRGY